MLSAVIVKSLGHFIFYELAHSTVYRDHGGSHLSQDYIVQKTALMTQQY